METEIHYSVTKACQLSSSWSRSTQPTRLPSILFLEVLY